MEVTRSMLFEMKVPKIFWSDAVLTACYLINRMPSSIMQGGIPFSTLLPSESLFVLPPRIFDCVCFVRDHRPGVSKLDPKALKCMFMGYSHTQKGYRCYSPLLRKYFVTANVSFFESTPYHNVPIDVSELDKDLYVTTIRSTIPNVSPVSTEKPPPLQVYT